MEINHLRRVSLELRDDEIDAMREILCLAHAQLKNSPCIQMRGIPMKKQCGLVGPQLFRVKAMLEQMGNALGANLPYDETTATYQISVR